MHLSLSSGQSELLRRLNPHRGNSAWAILGTNSESRNADERKGISPKRLLASNPLPLQVELRSPLYCARSIRGRIRVVPLKASGRTLAVAGSFRQALATSR